MRLTLLLLFSILQIHVFSQHQKTYRDTLTVSLSIDSRNSFTHTIDPAPYFIDHNELQIYAGEVLYIEIEHKKRKILSMHVVEENKNPERTILISFDQSTRLNTHQGMNIRVTNPFEYRLKWKAEAMDIHYIWRKIRSFQIKAHNTHYSILQEPIVSLLLSDFKFK